MLLLQRWFSPYRFDYNLLLLKFAILLMYKFYSESYYACAISEEKLFFRENNFNINLLSADLFR